MTNELRMSAAKGATDMYRMGWPAARLLGRFGVPLVVRVLVEHDAEAGVFVGTSPDLRGLVVEAETLDELAREVRDLVPALLETQHRHVPHVASQVRYTEAAACA